jgi:hypothetical protein
LLNGCGFHDACGLLKLTEHGSNSIPPILIERGIRSLDNIACMLHVSAAQLEHVIAPPILLRLLLMLLSGDTANRWPRFLGPLRLTGKAQHSRTWCCAPYTRDNETNTEASRFLRHQQRCYHRLMKFTGWLLPSAAPNCPASAAAAAALALPRALCAQNNRHATGARANKYILFSHA